MKFGIFGDIHGNLEAFEAVLEDMQAQQVEKTACVGDVVGQFTNPRECLEIVRALGCPLVKGNRDVLASESGGRHLSKEQCEFLQAQPLQRLVSSFAIVHSSLDHPSRWEEVFFVDEAERSFQQQETDVCFFGHTHLPHVFIRDTKVHEFFYKKIDVKPGKKYFVNVGSVGEPRDGDWRAAYVIYDSNANTIELRRLPFDLAKFQAKNRGSGLI